MNILGRNSEFDSIWPIGYCQKGEMIAREEGDECEEEGQEKEKKGGDDGQLERWEEKGTEDRERNIRLQLN